MPSKTPKQAKFMRAIAHGWTPSRAKNPPSRAVAQEFVDADRKYSGGFAENRYYVGGLAAMDNPNAGYKGRLDWQRGGRTRRNGGGRRGGAGAGTGTNVPTVTAPPSPWGTEAGTTQEMLDRMGYSGPMGYIGVVSGLRQAGWTAAPGGNDGDLRNTMWYPPEGTLTGEGGPGGPSGPPPRIIPTDPTSYVGAAPAASGAESPLVEQLRQHKAKIAATLGSARGGHVTGYAEGGTTRADNPFDPVAQKYQWRSWERKYGRDPDVAEVEAVEAEEEVVEPEEEEGGGIAAYLRSLFTPDPETAIGSGEARGTTEEQLEEMGQAYGGRVGYQAGGLAMAAPAGGVPPWIEPTGSGPGYMEEEVPGYQFGGRAAGMAAPMRAMRGRRGGGGRGGGRGGQMMPRGGVMGGPAGQRPGGLAAMMQQRGGLHPGAQQPRGIFARMMQQRQQQGALHPGAQGPGGGGFMGRLRQMVEQQRAQQPGGGGGVGLDPYSEGELRRRGPRGPMAPGGGGGPLRLPAPGGGGPFGPNVIDENPMMDDGQRLYGPHRQQPGGGVAPGMSGTLGGPGYGEYPLGSAGPRMDPSDPRYRAAPPPGSTFAPGEGIPGGGNIPPWKRRSRIAPPPGKEPGGSGPFIPGGPRVPPNLQGYLQKMRMQNRPPANVGGGANRVGMQDQQGGVARALQRGTGRPPMSRRSAFGRAGRTR